MAPIIIIPLQIVLAYGVSKVIAATGDVVIGTTSKTIRAVGAVAEQKVATMETKAAKAKAESIEARVEAKRLKEEHADELNSEPPEAHTSEEVPSNPQPWRSVDATA